MTGSIEQRPVVVAADGSESGASAVRFAAVEADRRGLPLEVVNVVPLSIPMGSELPTHDTSLRHYGERVLAESVRTAAAAAGEVAVTTRLLVGARVPTLVDHAEDAAVLVIGARQAEVAGRVWTGATVAGVCSRSSCPVVVVPATWQPRERPPRVVVGFKSPHHAAELLERAFAVAALLGAELVVLHAWKLPGVYDDIVTDRADHDRRRDEETAVIEPLLKDCRESYPEVPVRIEVVHDQPAHALVEASRDADRLVMVRPLHGSFAHHLGATARGVLRESRCPVEIVVPAVLGADVVGLELEAEGSLER